MDRARKRSGYTFYIIGTSVCNGAHLVKNKVGHLMGIMDPMRAPMDNVVGPARSEDWGLTRIFDWHLHFCWLPSKCFLTDKNIWLKKCYKGTRIITGPGEPVFVDYYIDKFEFIKWNLRGKK